MTFGIVRGIGLAGKLIGHEGWVVNTIEFNRCGDRLVSGSDDRRVMLWNVATKALVLSYDSGHAKDILQARIIPFTDDRTIVTSGGDGQKLGQVADNDNVQTIELGTHNGRVHKLAVEPGSPHIFYSCGEDGFVQHFDLRSNSSTKLFCCSTFTGTDNLYSSNILSLNSIVVFQHK
ncbi:putative transcription factor WD40-like family [Helianthus annuus]|uniref:Transcription factor WD40-like family n=2 Tax=Helianthus annuus TaxID=4232 RepID=A0A9K3EHH2_HELAN|nr:putative transcription factor WD40-like family [Helianthus annuus]KAJ0849111.1 putative transcription factor WD40-like family [Helianthus annuus]KAJ0858122.1 putative transcription factor WD40-like family [Helianthus annuus]